MKVKVERTTKKPAIRKPDDPDPAEEDRVKMVQDDPEDQENQAVDEEELDFLPADLSAAISTATTKIATPTRNLIVSAILYLCTLHTREYYQSENGLTLQLLLSYRSHAPLANKPKIIVLPMANGCLEIP